MSYDVVSAIQGWISSCSASFLAEDTLLQFDCQSLSSILVLGCPDAAHLWLSGEIEARLKIVAETFQPTMLIWWWLLLRCGSAKSLAMGWNQVKY